MATTLSGPRRGPRSGKPASQLVVLLHGLGADGEDLIGLADPLSLILPDAAFVAPDAPHPCDMAPFGYQWFSVQNRDPSAIAAGVERAAPLLRRFLVDELAALGLDAGRLALVGFSQGTMMALHVGLRLAPAPAAIVGFSGALVAPERLAGEARGKPPVLLIHGNADDIVPFGAMDAAETALRLNGVPVETVTRPGLGHGIDEPGLGAATGFLVRHLRRGQTSPGG